MSDQHGGSTPMIPTEGQQVTEQMAAAQGPPHQSPPAYPPSPPPAKRNRPWLVPLLAGALVVAIIAAVLAFTVFKSDGSSSDTYKARITAALRPVVSTNRHLSTSLA